MKVGHYELQSNFATNLITRNAIEYKLVHTVVKFIKQNINIRDLYYFNLCSSSFSDVVTQIGPVYRVAFGFTDAEFKESNTYHSKHM